MKTVTEFRKRKWVGPVLALLLLQSPASYAQQPGPRIHNYADSFLAFWSKNKGRTISEQVEAFKVEVAPKLPEFYQFKFDRWKQQGKDVDEMLGEQLRAFPRIAEFFAEKNRLINAELEGNLATFQKAFDDFDTDFDVYILHSLGEMDGGARMINGKQYFIFGIDGIIEHHNADTDVPFYHHEFFHMYHYQNYVGAEKLWAALWAEGLATYVSGAMNPGSSYRDMMLDVPPGLVEKCEADLPYLWAKLAEKLDSGSEDDYATFFLFSSKDPRIPKRAGYYLGYLIAKELSQGRTLKELARLDGEVLRSEIAAAITKLTRKKAGGIQGNLRRAELIPALLEHYSTTRGE